MTVKNKIEMLRKMIRVRLFEEVVAKYKLENKIPGPVHTSIGEEAVDALQSVLQFPETRTREFRGRGRRNTRRSGIIQCVSAGRLTRHHLARYAEHTCNVLLEHVVRVIGLPLVHDPGHVLSRPPGQCWLVGLWFIRARGNWFLKTHFENSF